MKLHILILLVLLCLFAKSSNAADRPLTKVIGWGINFMGEATGVPSKDGVRETNEVLVDGRSLTNVVAIAAGEWQGLALLSDGTVVGWGANGLGTAIGRPTLEPPWSASGRVAIGGQILSNTVAISAWEQSLALRKDGSVVRWGLQANPDLQIGPEPTNLVTISTGQWHSLGLRADGTVIRWPGPAPGGLSNIVSIAATQDADQGEDLVLQADGKVLEWSPRYGLLHSPNGLSNVVAIAAGGMAKVDVNLALTKDGRVFELPTRSGEAVEHAGLSNVVAIAAGGPQCMALKRDGTVVAWGEWGPYQATVPRGLSNVVAIAAGRDFCLALQTNAP
jgi:alpha-tubulin suppressor-like RCC1 family protein